MIYLVQSYYNDKQNHPRKCLKIGYAKNIEDRMKAYKTYNPSIQLLKIREGEYDLESFLHRYFDKYKLSDFNEWFIYKKEIIDKFDILEIQEDTITREEYLEYIRKEIITNIIPEIYKDLRPQIPNLLDELKQEFKDNYNIYSSLYTEFPEKECKEIIIRTFKFLRELEIDYFANYTFSDIIDEFPRIMSRQRLKENPWKNRAELYFKSLSNKNQRSQEEFMEIIQRKLKKSQNLLNIYNSTVDLGSRHDLAEKIMEGMNNYSSDYVSVNRHLGSDLVPEFNNLVMVSELRAFEIQQIDYKDRFSVFSCISSSEISIIPDIVDTSLQTFNSLSNFVSKMKFLCDLSSNGASELDIELIFNQVPLMYKNYYYVLGKDRIKSLSYQKSRLDEELQNRKIINIKNDDFLRDIKELYKPLDKVSFSKVKSDLKNLYESHGVKQTAKAKDIEKYYNVQLIKFSKDPKTGKRENGYEILGLKE